MVALVQSFVVLARVLMQLQMLRCDPAEHQGQLLTAVGLVLQFTIRLKQLATVLQLSLQVNTA